tara:strand:- start:6051 stop:7337 length:1287 start_codon:yes stop_codon:yes gene_type:complete
MAVYVFMVVALFFYRIAFGPYINLSLFHVFLISHSLLILVGLPFLDQEPEGYRTYYWSAILVPFIFLIGGLFVRLMPSKDAINTRAFLKMESVMIKYSWLLLAVFLAFLVLYTLDIGFERSAFLYALLNPGDSVGAMDLRLASMESNLSPYLNRIYGYTRSIFVLFICSFFTVEYCRGRISKILFLLIVFSSIFYCAYSAAKAPIFYLILAMSLSFYWYRAHASGSALGAWKALSIFMAIVVLGLGVSAAFYPILHGYSGFEAVTYAFDQVFDRIFLVPGRAAFLYFDVFGAVFDHPGLQSVGVVASFLGNENVSLASYLYSYMYDNQFSDKGLINASFFATAYGYFGLIGMFNVVLFSGFIVGFVQKFIDMIPTIGIRASVQAVCALAVAQLSLADLTSTLFGRGLVLIPVLVFFASIFFTSLLKRK